jgi:acyl-coenzyme A thioesterase PaaI-like protein
MTDELCLQERYAPSNACFGCGPSNDVGLRIRSFPLTDDANAEVVATWQPAKQHEAFEGMLNGGIIGALLDCHSNWTAAWHLMKASGESSPPCTVTADFHVRMKRPTPSDRPVELSARPIKTEGKKVVVEATLRSGDTVTATCTGTFVAVQPGHPAYHRW